MHVFCHCIGLLRSRLHRQEVPIYIGWNSISPHCGNFFPANPYRTVVDCPTEGVFLLLVQKYVWNDNAFGFSEKGGWRWQTTIIETWNGCIVYPVGATILVVCVLYQYHRPDSNTVSLLAGRIRSYSYYASSAVGSCLHVFYIYEQEKATFKNKK